jgi:hypothetical protein
MILAFAPSKGSDQRGKGEMVRDRVLPFLLFATTRLAQTLSHSPTQNDTMPSFYAPGQQQRRRCLIETKHHAPGAPPL